MIIINTTKKTICCGKANNTAEANTINKLLPESANNPIAINMVVNEPVKTARLENRFDKTGNKAAAIIPKKILIVDKIENEVGLPIM